MSLTIVMTTHRREPSYLEETLASYRETCDHPLKILVHELPGEDEYCSDRFLTPEEHAEKQSLGTRVRVAHATRLALEMADSEVILLQDDVKFAPGWLGKLADALTALDAEQRAHALVSLYSHRTSEVEGLVRWDPKSYWGLQAMFFGEEARRAAIERAFQTSGPLRMWPKENGPTAPGADVRLQQWLLADPKYTLYAIYPSLVQHTGMVSSIATKIPSRGNPGRSPTFPEEQSPVRWPSGHGKRSK